jgi:hypothetical protein
VNTVFIREDKNNEGDDDDDDDIIITACSFLHCDSIATN